MSADKKRLLDPVFLRKLERLRIQARRAFPGTMRGERRSTRRGSSVEFADFRKYEAGDDFRHVDWNIYARLERLMLRQFVEEEDVRIDILLDRSRSMHFGRPFTKFEFACRASAALAFLAVSSLDRVALLAFDSAIRSRTRALRGRGHLTSVLNFLEALSEECESDKGLGAERQASPGDSSANESRAASGESLSSRHTDLSAVLRSYQKSALRPGVLFVISDFFDSGDFRRETKLLAHRGFDVNLIQVLAPEELNPEVGGDLLLADSETGEEREVTANERVVAAYKTALSEFTGALESFSRTAGIGYTLLAADTAFEDLLLKNLIESRMAE
ncbi:MAG: DUF58 domain-containing protein [Blastocatellia bacterium]|nr:DUF58 domain-containing protein [Blastocatellia bacterium]